MTLDSVASSTAARPRFLNGLELSQLNWETLANGQEWRRDLLLRGLPAHLGEKAALMDFLAAEGFADAVRKVSIVPNKGVARRVGAAVVRAASAEAALKLARAFHGAQLAGPRSPRAAVSFAAQRTPGRAKGREPMRVRSNTLGASQEACQAGTEAPSWVGLPPGLEPCALGA